MGIKFDILSDFFILQEDSNFSRFFDNPEPIKIIHDVLRVAADANVTLSPTSNRHHLWDALRDGKALFVVNNKKDIMYKNIHDLRDSLNAFFEKHSKTKDLAQKTLLNNVIQATDSIFLTNNLEKLTSKQAKEIRKKILKVYSSIYNKIKPWGKTEQTVCEKLSILADNLITSQYVLVKRVTSQPVFIPPHERNFKTRDEKDKTGKVFGQKYKAWFFDSAKLISTNYYSSNSVIVYNELFPGRGDRDFYIIENEQFLRQSPAPFHSTKEHRFEKLIIIEPESIHNFVTETLNKYNKLINNKIKVSFNALKQKTHEDIENLEIDEKELQKNINDYRRALQILNRGFTQIEHDKLFLNFLKHDPNIDIKDYEILAGGTSSFHEPYKNPFKEDDIRQRVIDPKWKKITQDKGIEIIQDILKSDDPEIGIGSLRPSKFKTRLKSNKNQIMIMTAGEIMKNPSDFEIYNDDAGRWEPFTPTATTGIETTGIETTGHYSIAAISFQTQNQYNVFQRKFTLFAMRNIVKSPELKELEDIISGL